MKLLIGNEELEEQQKTVYNKREGNGGGGGPGGHERKVVLVGVKLNEQSRELLTWALMKLAQTGDRVIALHVLSPSSVEQSSPLSLVKTFDSVIAVYEGFCHLKQVDLKLKVCRGSSVRKILIREAKAYESAILVVGTSKCRHTIRSPVSVAKHCSRKLPRNFSVFAVDNGKIVFHRTATPSPSANCGEKSCATDSQRSRHLLAGDSREPTTEVKSVLGRRSTSSAGVGRRSAVIKRYLGCGNPSSWAGYSCDIEEEDATGSISLMDSVALVPYQVPEGSSEPRYVVNHNLGDEKKQGWALLRRVFQSKQHHRLCKVGSCRNNCLFNHLPKSMIPQSMVAINPDEEQADSTQSQKDERSLNLNGENGAIVAVETESASSPHSPTHGLKSFARELEGFHAKYSSMCRLFTYLELASATSGFLPERMVGKGGSSHVFKGYLSDGKELAVKILKPTEEGLEEFVSEIEIVTSVSHKNIISLFGYCIEHECPILVYDYLPRGSLEENLHDHSKDANVFGWVERYKVALGVAEALDHLHNGKSQPVVHRDVKSSNILLAEDYEPQLSDFGLATWASNVSSYMACTDVAGTFGYLAPEYFMHGKVTEKIDVYAFGVVLLELLSGRKPIDNQRPKGQESLVMWASPILKNEKILQLIDARLGSVYNHDEAERMALAANLCIRRSPLFRPRISTVLKLLQGDTEITKWARQQLIGGISDDLDAESSPKDVIQSHLNLMLLDLDDDAISVSSCEQNLSLEDYLKGRWSRSPSFN